LASAEADMDLIARRLAHEYPQNDARETTVKIVPEIDKVVGSVRLLLLVSQPAIARGFLNLDPTDYARRGRVPTLILQGGKDIQVTSTWTHVPFIGPSLPTFSTG
jgi:fermentation-respiration switch protein FrsA (DUF1100 family)